MLRRIHGEVDHAGAMGVVGMSIEKTPYSGWSEPLYVCDFQPESLRIRAYVTVVA